MKNIIAKVTINWFTLMVVVAILASHVIDGIMNYYGI